MKKILLVALVLSLSLSIGLAQDKVAIERANHNIVKNQSLVNPNMHTGQPARATLTLLESFDVGLLTGEGLCAGIDFDGTDWWMTGTGDGSLYGNYALYQIDRYATTFTKYSNPQMTWYPPLDIADAPTTDVVNAAPYDYDGYNNDVIPHTSGIADPSTILGQCTFGQPTGQCYDPDTGTYWVMEAWNANIHNIDANGTLTQFVDGSPGTMGMAMDKRIAGYDYIWTFQQVYVSYGVYDPQFMIFDPQMGMYLTETYSATGTELPGGACIADVTGYTNPVLVGLFQAADDYVDIYELPALAIPGAMVDIKANGGDAGVVVFQGSNVSLDIDVTAAGDTGLNADIWVLVKNDGGKKWSYNMAAARWFKGWCQEYVSAPLTDYTDNVLDMPLPVGFYDAYLGIDTNMNGNLNVPDILVYDHVDFEVRVPAAGFNEDFEAGTSIFTPDPLDPAGWSVGPATTGAGANSYYYQSGGTGYHYQGSLYKGGVFGDFTLSCDTAHITTATYSNIYYHGLCFRAQGDAADSYVFYVHSNGKIGIRARVSDTGGDLFSSYSPVGMNIGRDVKNNLEVVAIGSSMDLYINANFVTNVVDSTWAIGEAGLYAEGTTSNANLYEYDDVILN